MTTSPSEFLLFYRRVITSPVPRSLAKRASIRGSQTRSSRGLHQSLYARQQKGNGTEQTHTLDRDDRTNIQVEQSQRGRESRAEGDGGTATTQKDDRSNTARAKKEHPEAPDVVIGMQDERGTKGH
ncbi:hypothetical protein K431DRAFT_284369 [Polychaeton citri CBS 116435]|uniref:Uncharacterized protein n=1 Tax=Polychaeton citri CBS 116435 TaxID=1314669 RepID=A0A9P4URC0_9PEZI|nr:hypothetical protein K431DRAFT_284369 [Polychaeton citri CBS 116435]